MNFNDMLPRLSGVNEIDSLVNSGYPNFNYDTSASGNTVTYSFECFKTWSGLPDDISAVAESQKPNIERAMTYLGKVTGINFVETHGTETAPDIFFGYSKEIDNSHSAMTYAYYHYNYDGYGNITQYDLYKNVIFNWNTTSSRDLAYGTYGYQTVLHELGHAMGLKHPFEGSVQLPDKFDTTAYTLMSYTHADCWYADNWEGYNSFDFEALNWLYGRDGVGGRMYDLDYALSETNTHEWNGGPALAAASLAGQAAAPLAAGNASAALALNPYDQTQGILFSVS